MIRLGQIVRRLLRLPYWDDKTATMRIGKGMHRISVQMNIGKYDQAKITHAKIRKLRSKSK